MRYDLDCVESAVNQPSYLVVFLNTWNTYVNSHSAATNHNILEDHTIAALSHAIFPWWVKGLVLEARKFKCRDIDILPVLWSGRYWGVSAVLAGKIKYSAWKIKTNFKIIKYINKKTMFEISISSLSPGIPELLLQNWSVICTFDQKIELGNLTHFEVLKK